jgi:hypothetical protein
MKSAFGIKYNARQVLPRREVELLLACAHIRLRPEASARIRELAGGVTEIDWGWFLKIALRHGVMPLVYRQLSSVCPDAVPSEWMERLRDYFYLNAAHTHRLTEALCEALRLFEDEGIPVVPFKGPTLALSAYGDVALRQFADLDVMVKQEDVRRASVALKGAGYRQQFELTPAQEQAFIASDCEHLFTLDEGRFLLELHWQVARRYFALPFEIERAWTRLVSLQFNGRPTHTFSPEDTLLIVCINAGKDRLVKLAPLCDIAEIVQGEPEIDWNQIVSEAEAMGASRMLFTCLLLAEELLGLRVPKEVRRRFIADSSITTLVGERRARLFRETLETEGVCEKTSFHLNIKDHWKQKWQHLFRYAATSTPEDWNFIKLPDCCFFLYPLVRPLRVANQFISSSRS